MKALTCLVLLSFSFTVNAGLGWDLGKGIKKGSVELQKVKISDWLEEREAELEFEYDFSENVSYVFEDAEEILEDCEFDADSYEELNSDGDYHVIWNKAVKTYRSGKKKTKAYVGALMVTILGVQNGEMAACEVNRGIYAINTKGEDVTDYLSLDLLKYIKN